MVELEVLRERLAEARSQLINEIQNLGFDGFNKSPGESSWSVAQVCHHLYLAEKSFTSGLIYGMKSEKSQKADAKPLQLYLLDRTKKIDAPSIVAPSMGPFELQQILNLLEESRANLLTVMDGVKDKTVLTEKSAKHPLFGYLPLYQWIENVYLHDQRHIEQIKEIKSEIL
ncbi:DinB family protein [Neobacillus sp. SAB-20_R2A]|uniref:DinB family protein n=1 Tax=Neobacillus sp. SAB-20_R2A TaxID=3120519 RepID=UPI003C6E92D6